MVELQCSFSSGVSIGSCSAAMICTGTATLATSSLVSMDGWGDEMTSTRFLPGIGVNKVLRSGEVIEAACDSKEGEQKSIETFGAKLEDSPSAPAIPDSANFLETMILLQSFGGRFDFWEALFFGMALEEKGFEIEIFGFLWICHRV